MNKIFKLVWSKNKSAWIAVNECTRGVQHGSGSAQSGALPFVDKSVRGFSKLTALAIGLVGLFGLPIR